MPQTEPPTRASRDRHVDDLQVDDPKVETVDADEWRAVTPAAIRGRGAAENPANRFERLHYEAIDSLDEGQELGEGRDDSNGTPQQRGYRESGTPSQAAPRRGPRTIYLRDSSRSILSWNDSPDVFFDASVNPYRGCEHGCVYCYARPTHEWLGFSSGLDFETRILVKTEAPALLRRALASKSWTPQVVGLSGVTDPYQPIEARLGLTRGCLEVFADFRNPVAIVTKNALVTRDVGPLSELAHHDAVVVNLSITTLDDSLRRKLEPRASRPESRLDAISELARAGIRVGVMVAPVIPGLNDHEIPRIIEAAARAGARHAGYIVMRLPHGVKDLFSAWLERHHPDRRSKILNRVRALRGGELNDRDFGSRMTGEGLCAEQIRYLFELAWRRAGLEDTRASLSTAAFRRTTPNQFEMF